MNDSSRLLGVVVAALLAASGNAAASVQPAKKTYNLDSVEAEPPDRYDFSGSVGPGGYYDGASRPERNDWGRWEEPDPPTCDDVLGMAPDGCDLANPPVFLANGCGGGPTAGYVPDSLVLVVNGSVTLAFEDLFTPACNDHDACYAAQPGNKQNCDDRLPEDMLLQARTRVPPMVWRSFGTQIINQINLYGAFFDSSVGSKISEGFFQSAQDESLCRSISNAAALYCRSYQ